MPRSEASAAGSVQTHAAGGPQEWEAPLPVEKRSRLP